MLAPNDAITTDGRGGVEIATACCLHSSVKDYLEMPVLEFLQHDVGRNLSKTKRLTSTLALELSAPQTEWPWNLGICQHVSKRRPIISTMNKSSY